VGGNKIMLYGIFKEKLHKLNPSLRIFENCPASQNPWGLYLVKRGGMELEHICGINPIGGMVYELTERRWDGHILRQGWRRVLKILLAKKLIDRNKTASVFGTTFEGNRGRGLTIEQDPLSRAMQEAKVRGYNKTGVEGYVEIDDLVDIHRWREKLRQDKTNYWA
jgi:hypothetical protein